MNIDFLYWLETQVNKWRFTIDIKAIPHDVNLADYSFITSKAGKIQMGRDSIKQLRQILADYHSDVAQNWQSLGVGF